MASTYQIDKTYRIDATEIVTRHGWWKITGADGFLFHEPVEERGETTEDAQYQEGWGAKGGEWGWQVPASDRADSEGAAISDLLMCLVVNDNA